MKNKEQTPQRFESSLQMMHSKKFQSFSKDKKSFFITKNLYTKAQKGFYFRIKN